MFKKNHTEIELKQFGVKNRMKVSFDEEPNTHTPAMYQQFLAKAISLNSILGENSTKAEECDATAVEWC